MESLVKGLLLGCLLLACAYGQPLLFLVPLAGLYALSSWVMWLRGDR